MDWTERHLVDVYVFGYPLVYNVSSLHAIAEHGMGALPAAGFNAFAHGTSLATPDEPFVSVNNDTIYSIAQLDLSGGPLVLHVPDTGGAYYVLQFVDAWTNNFAYVGRRATGTAEGTFLITPPGWSGEVPDGVPVIASPTDITTIVGRLAVEGDDDVPRVRALQAQLTLTPMDGNGPLRGIPHEASGITEHLRFWELLRRWSQAFPPSEADRAYLARFADYGLTDPGNPYGVVARDLDEHLEHAFAAGRNRVEELAREGGDAPVNGWQGMPHVFDYNVDHLGLGTIDAPEWKIADREKSYEVRASSARGGLWGNHGYEAYYAGVYADAAGEQLNGAHAYELRLAELPPADAFWSITMYSMPDFYLVANPIRRYSIGDRTPGIVMGDDGSLAIRMQHERPDDEIAAANWLPTPEGDFRPMLRVYQPRAAMFDGSYVMPAITRIG
ncbi:DUF1254 domain-containing protein [Agromyces bauzanensis]|uniref:DUF1254 domain-containing protein n=1 Tax=Agromyces bauzanensis TaxID=1308924 RepID=A0A917PL40_9MICO|nr:DUF1254 domain-containing protein [Agromyces bauzanensis]GGJ82417.1 hypothetical protein GCM10011372_21010 [Agromyces bauzanensis]